MTNSKHISSTIELWAPDRLVTRNARTHSHTQIDQIAASIEQFGFTNPILVDTAAGILAGHARLLAALALGLKLVPVIVLDHLTDMEKRAYIIADNRLALNAGSDDTLLAQELALLQEEGFPLQTVGFDQEELAALLAEETAPAADPDAAPEARPDPVSRSGDVWLLGPHRVHCGDATLLSNVELLMEGNKAGMVFTDPPYNVNYCAAGRRIENDHLGSGFGPFLTQSCANMLAVTEGAIYICMSSSELHTLYRSFTSAGGHWSTFLIWSRDRFTLGRADYQRQYEPILYGWKQGSEHYWCGDRSQGDVWCVDKPRVNDLHPTMKWEHDDHLAPLEPKATEKQAIERAAKWSRRAGKHREKKLENIGLHFLRALVAFRKYADLLNVRYLASRIEPWPLERLDQPCVSDLHPALVPLERRHEKWEIADFADGGVK